MKNSKFKIHNSKYKIQNLSFEIQIQNLKFKILNSKIQSSKFKIQNIQNSKFKIFNIQNIQYSKFKMKNVQNSKFIFPQQPSGLGFQSLYPGLRPLRGSILAECTEVVWVTSVEHYFSVFTTLSYWNWASPQRRSPRR